MNVEIVNLKTGYLSEISLQSMEDATCLILASFSKMWEMCEERDKLWKELLSKKKPVLDQLENFQPNQKAFRDRGKVWLNSYLLKRLGMWIMDLFDHLQRSQD